VYVCNAWFYSGNKLMEMLYICPVSVYEY
jgi:hypothetical protein